jgi:hypothetical protein
VCHLVQRPPHSPGLPGLLISEARRQYGVSQSLTVSVLDPVATCEPLNKKATEITRAGLAIFLILRIEGGSSSRIASERGMPSDILLQYYQPKDVENHDFLMIQILQKI